MDTQVVDSSAGLVEAEALLRAGEVVAFPTETVYGLGADARRDDAVAKIYAAKGRPAGNPLIVHVAEAADARGYAAAWPKTARALAEKFWPGPLTMIVTRGPRLSAAVSAGRGTVALRCPAHPVAQELLRMFNGPVAAPSANRSGFTSPTAARHVYAELAGRIPLILDGGECAIGLESTVIDLSGAAAKGGPGVPVILRPGAIDAGMIRAVIGEVTLARVVVDTAESAASPGQHARHYAPRTPAYRFEATEWEKARALATAHGPVVLLTWSDGHVLAAPHQTMRMPGDDAGYARVFYAALREADEAKAGAILVLGPPSEERMWTAVADRLQRATVPLP